MAAIAALRPLTHHACRTEEWLYVVRTGGDLPPGHAALRVVDGVTGEPVEDCSAVVAVTTVKEMGVAWPDLAGAGPEGVRKLFAQLMDTGFLPNTTHTAPPEPLRALSVEIAVLRESLCGLHEMLGSKDGAETVYHRVPQLTPEDPDPRHKDEYVRLLNKARDYADYAQRHHGGKLDSAESYFSRAFTIGGCAADYKDVCSLYKGILAGGVRDDASFHRQVCGKFWVALLQYAGYLFQEHAVARGYAALLELAERMCADCVERPFYGAHVVQSILGRYLAEVSLKHGDALRQLAGRAPVEAWGSSFHPPAQDPSAELGALCKQLRAAVGHVAPSAARKRVLGAARELQATRKGTAMKRPLLDLHLDEEWLLWAAAGETPTVGAIEALNENYTAEQRIEELLDGSQAVVVMHLTAPAAATPTKGLHRTCQFVLKYLRSSARTSTRHTWRCILIELYVRRGDREAVDKTVAEACETDTSEAHRAVYRRYPAELHLRRLRKAVEQYEEAMGASAAAAFRAELCDRLAEAEPPQ